jgi:hypothetical protein
MLQQEIQPTATPATRWSPLLEDDDDEDDSDEYEEEDSDDEQSGEEESPQFHRRVLEFDFENDNDTGVVGREEGAIENDDQEEGDDDESGDQDDDDSSSSGGSTVVAFNNISFQNSPASGDTGSMEHQDGLRPRVQIQIAPHFQTRVSDR